MRRVVIALAVSAALAAMSIAAASQDRLRLPQSRMATATPGSISIEAEDLVGSASASAGQVVRQDMRGFGQGWSGNAQLFWGPPPPSDAPIRNWPHLSLSFVAPAAGTYDVVLHHTAAPDFGTIRVFLDGQPTSDIDGYAPTVLPRARTLGQRTLTAGRHELVVTVMAKSAASRGFAVGLDRLELQPVITTPAGGGATSSRRSGTGQGGAPMTVAPIEGSGQLPVVAQLYFGEVNSITQQWTAKGGTEKPFDRPSLTAHLVWESGVADKLSWRWQAARQPFSGPSSSSPAGLVGQGEVKSPTFTIDLGSLPPLNGSPARMMRGPVDFYIRLIAVRDGQPVGAPSNVVVAHYVPGSDQSFEIGKKAFEEAEHQKAMKDAEALAGLYDVNIVSFTPATFADPNRWGCVVITKNPYATNLPNPHRLWSYEPGEHCGASYTGQGYQATTVWDYLLGWAKAYEIASSFYDEAKAWAASQFAEALPCEALGKGESDCEKFAGQLSGAALNVGLTAAGVPPSLPNLSAVAKGEAADAGVDFTCMAIENSGGECSPQLRSTLTKAYKDGLDKLASELDTRTKEPGCGDATIAHQHGREPLPCFAKYAGVQFTPATHAVYEPPLVTVRLTRKTAALPNSASAECGLRVTLWLKKKFPGGTIESYYKPVPPTDLAGEPFAPARLELPALAPGQSANVTVPLGGIQPYKFSSTEGGYAVHNGWCALYNGGNGSLTVSLERTAGGGACAAAAQQTVEMPNDAMCSQ